MILLLTSILCAFWFNRELMQFPNKINKQIYEDMHSLFSLPFSLSEFQATSRLQYQKEDYDKLIFILLPTFSLCFHSQSIFIIGILFILTYLSFLDYHYYLTDIHYISLIFTLSLTKLVFNATFIDIYLSTLLFTLLFFLLFIPLFQRIFKKTALGSGDGLLLIALSPLFDLYGMIHLLLISSLCGLLFSGGYWLRQKRKLAKLPFIPFITLGFLICIMCGDKG